MSAESLSLLEEKIERLVLKSIDHKSLHPNDLLLYNRWPLRALEYGEVQATPRIASLLRNYISRLSCKMEAAMMALDEPLARSRSVSELFGLHDESTQRALLALHKFSGDDVRGFAPENLDAFHHEMGEVLRLYCQECEAEETAVRTKK